MHPAASPLHVETKLPASSSERSGQHLASLMHIGPHVLGPPPASSPADPLCEPELEPLAEPLVPPLFEPLPVPVPPDPEFDPLADPVLDPVAEPPDDPVLAPPSSPPPLELVPELVPELPDAPLPVDDPLPNPGPLVPLEHAAAAAATIASAPTTPTAFNIAASLEGRGVWMKPHPQATRAARHEDILGRLLLLFARQSRIKPPAE